MLKLKQFFAASNSAIALLVLAATGSLVFTLVAGLLVFGETKSLIASNSWVDHTQEVLATLQRASLLTERVEYRTHLYLLSKSENELDSARSSANLLEITTVHLGYLVADNAYQEGNVQKLTTCTTGLRQLIERLTQDSAVPEVQIQSCQETINLMADHEQSLLKDRNSGSQRSSVTSIGAEICFVALAVLTLLVLFGFLSRDILRHQRISKQAEVANERLAHSVNALEDRTDELDLLTSVRDELQLCMTVQQLYECAASGFSRLLSGTSGSLCIINNSRHLVEVVSSWEESGVASLIVDFNPPESCCGLRSGRSRWRTPGGSEIQCMHFAGPPPVRYLCMSITAHGNTVGVLYVQCPDDSAVDLVKRYMDGLKQLVQLTGMALATLNLQTKLENQSIRDSLTGLFNRHFMQISFERELSRAARRKQSLAVFMLDVDHFKKFNDTFGHAAGDIVLKAIAETFQAGVRVEDIICRYGGEEFTIILPDVTRSIAVERAETIRQAVASLRVPLGRETCSEFTVSIGVAFYPNDGETSELLLRRSDEALYRAKRQGRDQIVYYDALVDGTAIRNDLAIPLATES